MLLETPKLETPERRRRSGADPWDARNLRTLRLVDGPKVDIWTVRDGQAVHYFEMFDSYAAACALGVIDPPGR